MKAADITDEAVYVIVDSVRLEGGPYRCAMVWDMFRALPQFPQKVVMAKLRQMVSKGRLDGCACGCRGDFQRVEADPVPDLTPYHPISLS